MSDQPRRKAQEFTKAHSEVLFYEAVSWLQKIPNWLLADLDHLLEDGQVFAVQQLLDEAFITNEGGRE